MRGLSLGRAASSPPSPIPVQRSNTLPCRSQHAHRHAGALAGIGRLLILLPRPAAALVVLVPVGRGVRMAAVAPPLLARLTLLRAQKRMGGSWHSCAPGLGLYLWGAPPGQELSKGQKPETAPVA